MCYESYETLTIAKIEARNGNEISVKRDDGVVFTVRHVDASRYFVRDTRTERSPLTGYALSLAEIWDRINAAPGFNS